MKLIDADELRKYWKITKECIECHWNNRDCSRPPYYSLHDICEAIDEIPVIDAIPVEWLEKQMKLSHENSAIHQTIDTVIGLWDMEQEANHEAD